MKNKIIFFLLACSFILNLGLKSFDSNKDFNTNTFLTKAKIQHYIDSTVDVIDQYNQKNDDIGLFLSARLAILKSIDTIYEDPILIRNGKYAFWKIVRKAKIAHLKKILNFTKNNNSHSFTYRKGKGKEINKNSFTVLSLNVCFLPDDMPLFFGGMLPWKDRIKEVSKFIVTQDSDIVCLQEVFDKKAQNQLFKKLRKKYAHFYTGIGPSNYDGSLSSLGFESGLFVASKYPLKNPAFHPFKDDNPHINRGFFVFEPTKSNGEVLGKIFTTHLAPFEDGKDLREKELTQVISLMQESNDTEKPVILCGDLNLPIEEAKKWINAYFEDYLNINEINTSFNNFTSCDFTNHRLGINTKNIKPEYLDYILFFKNKANQRLKIKTSIVKTFDHNRLDNAITDHHALISNIEF